MSKKQFRIKYYDYNDSELYTIIQVAPSETRVRIDVETRLRKSGCEFKIIDVIELSPQYYIREIRKILKTAAERNEPNWLRKRKKTMV